MLRTDLLAYDRPVPRYTSYPPASVFEASVGPHEYEAALAKAAQTIGLYVHVPFCSKLCLYCGCNVVITPKRERADVYLDQLGREVELVALALGQRRRVNALHLGGGSPNFLTTDQFDRLMAILSMRFDIRSAKHRSLEVHPAGTSEALLARAREHGFDRVSMGVQDLSPRVLELVARRSDAAEVERVLKLARSMGFGSVNFDLMYGLPGQDAQSVAETMARVAALGPDRIALFGYAHVPWVKPHQKALPEELLPDAAGRLDLLLVARERLEAAGYVSLGLDHFARPTDELALAAREGRLHRSFQGYSADPPGDLVALGASAISDVAGTYAQNAADLKEYAAHLEAGMLPVERGKILSADDRLRREVIMELMCQRTLSLDRFQEKTGRKLAEVFPEAIASLNTLAEQGLVEQDEHQLRATDAGNILLRVIASVFDATEARVRGSRAI